jgi:hypothetical protein
MKSSEQKHQFLYRVSGTKQNGRQKVHFKCSKMLAEAMAASWRRPKPGVKTMEGNVEEIGPVKDVTVTRSVRVVWPEEVPDIKADLLVRLADHLEDDFDEDPALGPDYAIGYHEAINRIIALSEDERALAQERRAA